MHNYLTLRSGKRLVVDAPTVDMIDITDIAYGTARKSRFAGQGLYFTSVAEHQIRGARWLLRKGFPGLARAFLLHDGSEAYFNDLPSPLKVQCPDYVLREEALQRVIFKRFSIPWAYMEKIHGIDRQLADEEGLINYPGQILEWMTPGRELVILADLDEEDWMKGEREIVAEYLQLFEELFGYAA